MGVHGLWELLAPVGRRVSVETLAGKKLAIDASIWMVQFMKAMRDEKGEMVRNAHLLGFFRRICKLLFLRTKPVFVFDGATPALKRRTVIARRRLRDKAVAKVRKTAEKLLLNQLKSMKLKELAKDIEKQKQIQKNDAKGETILSDQTDMEGSRLERDDIVSSSFNQEKLDEMLAASIDAEERGRFANNASTSSAAAIPSEEEEEEDGNEEEVLILPVEHGEVDPAVLAALPLSMQRDLLVQLKGKKKKDSTMEFENQRQMQDDDSKGKKILSDEIDMLGYTPNNDDLVSRSDNQEKLDEMLAASIAAEENGRLANNASESSAPFPSEGEDGKDYEDEDEDEDEEMMLPAMNGEVDPTVLASLPPSMQLDLLVQMRERLMAENRQKYQKVKKVGSGMPSYGYLVYVKDPAKFSELQIQAYLKTVSFRREIDEVQKSASGRGVGGVQTSRIASEANREFIFSSSFTGDKQALTTARAQGNGDKQQETLREHPSQDSINSVASTSKSDAVTSSAEGLDESRRVFDENIETYLDERGRVRVSRVRAMGIRMTRDLQRNLDLMKEIENESAKARKIANTQTMLNRNVISLPGSFPCKNQSVETSHNGNSESVDLNQRNEESISKNDSSIEISFEDDGENKCLDRDDDLFAHLAAGNPGKLRPPSRRATLVMTVKWNGRKEFVMSIKTPPLVKLNQEQCLKKKAHESIGLSHKKDMVKMLLLEENGAQQKESFCEIMDGVEKPDNVAGTVSETINSSGSQSNSSVALNSDHSGMLINKPCETYPGSCSEQSMQDASKKGSLYREMPCAESLTPVEKEVPVIAEQLLDTFSVGAGLSSFPNRGSEGISHISDTISGAITSNIHDGDKINDTEAEPVPHFTDVADPAFPLTKLSTKDLKNDIHGEEREHKKENSHFRGNENLKFEVAEANLEEEMLILDQEYLNLGDEQRKLERNAESVSSEMFAECQELLQMFGLPYIIAPMEAEAQCAYMELANLVDGVVTDDSDVFLFGARSVYKNIFDDRKYVETYFMKDIEKELGLTREQLVRMALLLGSDYTEGVSGIGIVNAIEVVNAFPEEDGLHIFREWIESPDPTILKKFDAETGSSAKKRGPKVGDGLNCSKSNINEVSASDQNISQAQEQKQFVTDMQDIKQIFMNKHRNVSKNWHIPSSFPSEAVITAYSSPQVDKSTEPFSWGKPDHFVLRKLCWEKFGWGSQKVDELIIPVLKEYDKRETQLRLEAFYTFNERFAKIRSKRIKKAVKGITGNQTSELMDDPLQEVSKSRKKRRVSPVEPGDKNLKKPSKKIEENDVQNQIKHMEKSTPKKSRKRRNVGEPVPSTEENIEPAMEAEGRQSQNRGSRGKGRGRGRGTGRGVGQGRGKRSSGFGLCESSDDDSSDEQEVLVDKLEGPEEVRRSRRFRKPVNYSVNDLEADDVDKSSDQRDKGYSDEEAVELDLSSAQGACGDAAAGHDEKKQHDAGGPALEEHLHKDYVEMGGGFCTDEFEIGQPDVSQYGDSFEAEFSEDYLKIGGGFCLAEGETQNDEDGAHDPTTATASGNADPSHCSGFMEEADLGCGSVQFNLGPKGALDEIQDSGKTDAYDTDSKLEHLNASSNDDNSKGYVSLQENTKNDTGITSVGGLSAMPFLKRKRRKS
uniref:DNA repair protein UVH3 n=1 Tax=Fagus sylvatica TaxID=28930 RepID=A0A2N9I1V5_FAGSY